jgi:hypothetical protein
MTGMPARGKHHTGMQASMTGIVRDWHTTASMTGMPGEHEWHAAACMTSIVHDYHMHPWASREHDWHAPQACDDWRLGTDKSMLITDHTKAWLRDIHAPAWVDDDFSHRSPHIHAFISCFSGVGHDNNDKGMIMPIDHAQQHAGMAMQISQWAMCSTNYYYYYGSPAGMIKTCVHPAIKQIPLFTSLQ